MKFSYLVASFLVIATANGLSDGPQRRTATATTTTRSVVTKLNASTIPKYATEVLIPAVLHDDLGKESNVEISLRPFKQQMLPPGYPITPIWGYGLPSNPSSYRHPSGTVEVTRNMKTFVTWRNELLVDPVACQKQGYSAYNAGCSYLPHLVQDIEGVPVIDQTIHWAAPNKICKTAPSRTDCVGGTSAAYTGPVPIVTHVHGSHTEARSDGYPSAWFLPKAANIPSGYATEGTFFQSRYLPSLRYPDDGNKFIRNVTQGDIYFKPATDAARGKGYAVFRYTNDQDTTALWYHDHTLGMTRLNVYAAGAGFWLIRDVHDNENLLAAKDAAGKPQSLPGPPAKLGQDPNNDLLARKQIREIPLAIQDKSFYSDGRIFYPANRESFEFPNCDNGSKFGNNVVGFPYKPNSDVSPIWNPEAFFDTIMVNGNTFPKFSVAPERYRLRMLNACDSRTVNLAYKIGSPTGPDLPFFIIGSDQGLLPQVVKIRTGFATKIQPGQPVSIETPIPSSPLAALLMAPGERYDTIVDFAGFANGTEIYLVNTGPDFPFAGFDSNFIPADPGTTGQVMKFVVNYSLRKGPVDTSTSPYNLVTTVSTASLTSSYLTPKTRDLAMNEEDSKVCVGQPNAYTPCRIPLVNCSNGIVDPLTGISSLSYGPIRATLGYNGKLGPGKLTVQVWENPIAQNPSFGATEIWEFWNWTPDAHPIHLHLVSFTVLGRFDMQGNSIGGPLPYESGRKDTVISYPGQVTKIQMTFDISGLFVWHCHVLSHEDNDMMVPYCVGTKGLDCPSQLF